MGLEIKWSRGGEMQPDIYEKIVEVNGKVIHHEIEQIEKEPMESYLDVNFSMFGKKIIDYHNPSLHERQLGNREQAPKTRSRRISQRNTRK